MSRHWKNHGKDGFTLIELIVVVAIISILAVVLVPGYFAYIGKADKTVCAHNRAQIVGEYQLQRAAGEDATLEAVVEAYKASNEEICPKKGTISVKDGALICSAHDDSADEGMKITTDAANYVAQYLSEFKGPYISGDMLTGVMYQHNGGSLPQVTQSGETWDRIKKELNPKAKLPQDLYWRANTVGKEFILFANPSNSKNHVNWEGYVCYYKGEYYVSTKPSGKSPVNISTNGQTAEEWLIKNKWKKVGA